LLLNHFVNRKHSLEIGAGTEHDKTDNEEERERERESSLSLLLLLLLLKECRMDWEHAVRCRAEQGAKSLSDEINCCLIRQQFST
jgi:hypothetical protein